MLFWKDKLKTYKIPWKTTCQEDQYDSTLGFSYDRKGAPLTFT